MDDELDESRPWYAAGLYRRIQERRRWRPERAPRKPWRQRLRERGLHWNLELVVGVFVAVVAVSLATVALVPGAMRASAGTGSGAGAGANGAAGVSGAAGGSGVSAPTASPACIAAPVAGVAKRVCTAPSQ